MLQKPCPDLQTAVVGLQTRLQEGVAKQERQQVQDRELGGRLQTAEVQRDEQTEEFRETAQVAGERDWGMLSVFCR